MSIRRSWRRWSEPAGFFRVDCSTQRGDRPMTIAAVALDGAARRATARLVIDGVSKRFGTGPDAIDALLPMSLAINAGDFVCIVGPSGCGKSTLLNIVAGFETPTSGAAML